MTGPYPEAQPRRGLRGTMTLDEPAKVQKVEVKASRLPEPDAEPPDPAETLRSVSVALPESLQPNTAMLQIHKGRSTEPGEHFRLVFHFLGTREESLQSDVDAQQVLDLSLAAISERQTWRADYTRLGSWWPTMHRLASWMERIFDAQQPVRLIVWDDTTFQIPWELYYLQYRADDTRSTWLGSVCDIVRWSSHLLPPSPHDRYNASPLTSTGPMLLMEAPDITDGVTGLVADYGPPAVQTMDDLLRELAVDTLRIALMMVHGHTENATAADEFRLAGTSLTDLEMRRMPALTRSKAVVILNACNTAKTLPLTADAHQATKSFAALFLRKGASAVIATLGRVGVDHTHAFMSQLLEDSGKETRLAGLLRGWRSEFTEQVKDLPNDDGLFKDFFNAFTYVCYGHPDTALRLTADVSEEEVA